MRNIYLKTLCELAERDSEVVSLVSDNGIIVYDDFKKNFPDRYYNFGIAEENMVAAAAGMASCGKIPFAYTISAFIAYRAYEFLRDDVCFQNQNVKLIGIGTGITYSTLGPSHHTTEDIALLRSLPNLTIFSPSTRMEVKWMMEEAYKIKGPVYIRLSNNSEEYYDDGYSFELGIPSEVKKGDEYAIFVTGSITSVAVKAAKKLDFDGWNVVVYSVHTLKPLNEKKIAELISKYKQIVVLEEHNVIGGLYSMLAEIMISQCITKPVLRIGLEDKFAVGYGTLDEVRYMNGIDETSVYEKVKQYLII